MIGALRIRLWLAQRSLQRARSALARWDEARWAEGQPALAKSRRRDAIAMGAIEHFALWGSILAVIASIPAFWLPFFPGLDTLRSVFLTLILIGCLPAPAIPVCCLAVCFAHLWRRLGAPDSSERERLRERASERLALASRQVEFYELSLASSRPRAWTRPKAARRL